MQQEKELFGLYGCLKKSIEDNVPFMLTPLMVYSSFLAAYKYTRSKAHLKDEYIGQDLLDEEFVIKFDSDSENDIKLRQVLVQRGVVEKCANIQLISNKNINNHTALTKFSFHKSLNDWQILFDWFKKLRSHKEVECEKLSEVVQNIIDLLNGKVDFSYWEQSLNLIRMPDNCNFYSGWLVRFFDYCTAYEQLYYMEEFHVYNETYPQLSYLIYSKVERLECFDNAYTTRLVSLVNDDELVDEFSSIKKEEEEEEDEEGETSKRITNSNDSEEDDDNDDDDDDNHGDDD